MTIKILDDIEKGKCMSCGVECFRMRIETFVQGFSNMYEVKWKYNCRNCHVAWTKINKYKKEIEALERHIIEIEDKILNENFDLFCRKMN